jgi:hypothetical protein
MILPCPRRQDRSVVQTNVLPIFTTAIHKKQFALFVCHGIQNRFACIALIIFCIVCIYCQ